MQMWPLLPHPLLRHRFHSTPRKRRAMAAAAAPAPKPPTPRGHHHHSTIPSRHLHVARCFPDPATKAPSPNPNPLLSLLSAVPDWADSVKERRVRDRRPLYNHASWRDHRSSRRHLRHLLSSLSSRVILSLVPPVSAFTAFATAIATYNTLLPAYALTASPLPYQLTAPALALLLVFRTEASYARFDEGRKAWMRVLAGAADLAGMVMHHPSHRGGAHGDDEPVRRALLNYILAFPVALKCHIISDSDVKEDLQGLLAEDDLNVVLGSKHRPRCIIEFISQSLQMIDFDEEKRSIMESKLSCFLEGIGVCEQLIGIPIPLSYTRLTSRFLVLWHLTLPVILWDECKWIVVPATFVSAASLFCIEEVGVLIEEPFPMLALDALCKQLHDGMKDMMAVQNSVHTRLVSKTKGHGGSRCPENGWPSSKREEVKID
ncbi:voltage-dependent chloride channel 1, chloroplastic-like [Phragmites australis]|uniref:voltage-dependent chloride channel 1, chloroplastic-like n=1 Tax=Phragmites australis TaxID=29695 RepID=UPI002D79363F|nr:voltage-dependent chloride channel 1, chloroplastic-like [Phragmites australis]